MLLTCRVFAGVLIGILFFGYMIYLPEMKQLIIDQVTKAAVRTLILTFAAILSYRIVNLPLLLLQLIAIRYVPKRFVEDAENYHISLSKENSNTQAAEQEKSGTARLFRILSFSYGRICDIVEVNYCLRNDMHRP